jgi:hypothetical protein
MCANCFTHVVGGPVDDVSGPCSANGVDALAAGDADDIDFVIGQ